MRGAKQTKNFLMTKDSHLIYLQINSAFEMKLAEKHYAEDAEKRRLAELPLLRSVQQRPRIRARPMTRSQKGDQVRA